MNTIRFCFLMLLIALFQPVKAQLDYKLHGVVKTPYSDFSYAVSVDSMGNMYYMLHLSDLVTDVDPGPGQFNITRTHSAFALIKLDTNGVLIFAKKIECTTAAGTLRYWKINPDRNGNINMIGDYTETVDFDPGPGTYAPLAGTGGSAFLARYDQNGDFVFMKPFTSSMGTALIVPSYFDDDGNACLGLACIGDLYYDGAQLTGNPPNNNYMALVWLNSSGTAIQHTFIDGLDPVSTFVVPEHVVLDSDSAIVVAGTVYGGSVDFDPGPGVSFSPPSCSYISKYAPDGTLEFVKYYNLVFQIYCLDKLSDNRILVAGKIDSIVDMDPGPGVMQITPYPNYGMSFDEDDAVFSLLDSSGIFIYAKRFGGNYRDFALRVAVDASDNFYLAGNFRNSMLPDTAISMQGIHSIGADDAFVACFNQNGINNYIFPLESTGPDYFINALLPDQNNHLVISGSYNGYIDFDLEVTAAKDSGFQYSEFFISRHKIRNESQTGFDYFKYSGIVYRDLNTDSIHNYGKPPLKNRLISKSPGSNISITDISGYYAGYSTDSINLIEPVIPFPALISSNPANHLAVLSALNPVETDNHFGLYPNTPYNDLSVEIISTPGLLFNIPSIIYITCTNNSIDSADASVRFLFDTAFAVDAVLPAADTAIAGNYFWNLGRIGPLEEKSVAISVINSTIIPGNTSIFTAHAYPIAGDLTPTNNTDVAEFPVTGSYDPNAKSVEPVGSITPVQVSAGQWLDYTIHFQNVGNDTAFRVLIADTLSALLDLSTLEIIGGSHSYSLSLDMNRMLVVRMDNISLPDSGSNFALSCGFFRYRIKPYSNLLAGDSILNNASIFFDLNPAVVTNETVTKVEWPVSVEGPAVTSFLKVIPTLTNGWIYVDNNLETAPVNLYVELTDITGKVLLRKTIGDRGNRIPLADMGNFPAGIYLVRVYGPVHTTVARIVKM